MTNRFLTIITLIVLFNISCKEIPKQEHTEIDSETVADNIVLSSTTDKNGKKLDIVFNNTKGIATLEFDGNTIELIAQKAASGFWYINNNYELRGKGNDMELKKDGEVVFKHEDDKVNVEVKNDNNDTLIMTFNNTNGTVKAFLNGGEQIDLVAEKAASGIWYKNENYELRGKGNKYDLTKNGKAVFSN